MSETSFSDLRRFNRLAVILALKAEGRSIDGPGIAERLALIHRTHNLFSSFSTAEALHEHIAEHIYKERYRKPMYMATEQELEQIRIKYLNAHLADTRDLYAERQA